MAEANTNSVQQAQDAQHLDNLTSLQQGGPQNGNSAGGTADATVNTSNPNQPDNPSLFNNANPVNNNNGDLTAKGNDSVLTPSAFANDGREGGVKDTPTVSTGTQRPEINPAAANAAPAAYQNPLPDIRGNNGIQEGPTSPAAPAAQQATQTINQPSTIAAVKTETEPTTEPTVNDKNLPNQPANGVPTSGVISGAAASLVLDESAVPTPLQNPVINDGVNDGIHSVTVNLASQFTHDYGNDGPGSIAYTLSLNGSNVGSGLYALDTGDKSAADGDGYGQGSEIVLNQSGNIITGSVGDKTYFMITVNPATGEVTFAQSNNIWHPTSGASIPDADDSATLAVGSGNLTLIQTVSDADGDSASSSLNLGAGVFSIQDDGPTSGIILGASASLTLDESSLPAAGDGIHTISADLSNQFSYTYGKDGAGSVVYTLSLSADGIGSGLYALDTGDKSAADGDGYGQGNEILLKLVDGEVRGYIDGKTYFTITVNPATGEVTFTQSSNIWNQTPGSGSPDEAAFLTLSTADQLTLVQTVLDGDGDSASSSLNLGAGVFSIQDDGPVVTGLASSGSITNQASASILKSLPTASLGTDGGQLVFGGSHTTVAGIDYWTDGAGHQLTSGGQLLIYTVDSKTGVMTATTADPTHKLIFTVTPDSSKGVYTVTMSGELDGNAKIQTADFTKALSGGNTTNAYFGNTSGTVVWATSTSDGVTPSTVNYSTQGVGVGNGSKINAGESLKLSFIQNPSLDGSGLGEKDPSTPTSPKYLLVNTATFTLDHFDQGENLVVKAYYTDNLGRHIVEVNLSKTSGSGVGSSTAADEPITITSKVIGQTFDTVVFEGVDDGGNGYRVANFTGYNSNEISENRITLTMTAIDGDNDQASTSWNVNFTAPVVNLQIASLMQSALDATSSSSFTVSENSIDVGMVINTTLDPASLIYSIVDGVDADKFIINSAGKLSFNNSPNYELPSDFDHDNVYNVIVRVSDGIHSAEYDMDVTVTDVNEAPTAVIISSVTSSLAENTSTTSRIKVADIAVADDAMGSEKISLSGTDAGYFELRGMSLYLKENTPLNYEAKASYDVTVTVADESLVGSTPLSTNYRLSVTDVNEAPTAVVLSGLTSSLAENTSTTSRIKVADIAVTDDALGNEKISLSGADENAFEVIGSELYIKAGISLNYEAKASYDVTVTVADESLVGSTPLSTNYKLRVTDVNESPIVSGETYSFVKNTASPIGNLFSNDSDPDGDAISIAKIKIGSTETNFSSLGNGSGVYSEYKKITMESGGGVLYLKSDGHFIFEAPNSLKTPTFQYAVTDGVNQSSYVTAKFTVTNSPIAMDINGDGIHYLSQEAGTTHDFNADGIAETTAWVAPEDGLLALQKDDGSHNIVFSTQAGETDLAGLAKVYDSNKDGQLNSSDADFAKFGVWQDANSDGIVQNGEFLSLADRGITSLSLTSDGQVHFEANGDVIVYGQTTYTTSDGQLHIAEDVGFAVNDVYEPLDIATLISNAEAIESITHIDQLGDTASSSSLMVELGGQTYEIATLNGQEAGTQDILSQFVGGDTSNNLLANKSWTDVIDIASDHGGPSSITAAGGAVADGAYSNGEGDWTVIVKSGDAKVDAAHNQITFSSESAENSVTIITADGASHDINNVDKIQWHG